MLLRQLQCFRTLMAQGTTVKTAECLGLSQPTVSMAIASLERTLGFSLFTRKSGRLIPTPEAILFYDRARSYLDIIEDIYRFGKEIKNGRQGSLAIAAYVGISTTVLPKVIAAFARKYPHINVKLISRLSSYIRDILDTQPVDLVIAESPINYPSNKIRKFRYRCKLLVPEKNPVVKQSVVTPHDIDGTPFVSFFRGDPMYEQLSSAFSGCNANWNIVAEVEHFASLHSLVSEGLGVGIADPFIESHPANTVLKAFEPEIFYEIAVMTRSETSKPAREFVEILYRQLALPSLVAND